MIDDTVVYTSASLVIMVVIYVCRLHDKVVNVTQEPVYLYDQIIRNHTQVGDTVVEVFAGSGTGAVAALLAGRNCVSLEIDPEQCKGIEARIRELQKIVLYYRKMPSADRPVIRQVTPAELDAGMTEYKAIEQAQKAVSKLKQAEKRKSKEGMFDPIV